MNQNKKSMTDGITLDSRVLSCTGSINFKDNLHTDLPKLLSILENQLKELKFVENYYLIAHGDTNTPHIHFAIELTGQKRLKTLLNDFEKLGYNRNAINITKLLFLHSTIRYFLHLTDESLEDGKQIYCLDNIISNMPYEYLEDVINLEDDELNTEKLIQICLECCDKISIMKRLGLKTFHKWRYEIDTILNYDYGLRFAREKERKRREEEQLNNLPF